MAEGFSIPGFVQGAELGYARCEGQVFQGGDLGGCEGLGLRGEVLGEGGGGVQVEGCGA